MIYETIGFFIILILLAVIGIGPALFLLASHPKQIVYGLALAPCLGYVLVLLLGFPLVLYLAPIQVWAIPFTVVLALVSIGLAIYALRNAETPWSEQGLGSPALWLAPLFLLLTCILLLAPMNLYGLGYAAFRT